MIRASNPMVETTIEMMPITIRLTQLPEVACQEPLSESTAPSPWSTMKKMDEAFGKVPFVVRVHRSYLVNLSRVISYHAKELAKTCN